MANDAGSRPKAAPYVSQTAKFRDGSDSPRQFLDRCLSVAEARDGEVKALLDRNFEGARAQADASSERWRKGAPLSPIDGMPIGVKDIIETIDMRTENGSPLYVGCRTDRDAATVAALREAGCVIVAKTVTTEFAATHPGDTCNPWDLSRTPGGSSSGSAAGAALGYFTAGLGTQVVGSILRPASFCGVVGYKPTFGAVNRGGSHDALSQSAHGALAPTLEDTWLVVREIASRAGGDPGCAGLYGPDEMPEAQTPRALAVVETAGWGGASDEAKQALSAACDRLAKSGIKIVSRKDNAAVEALEAAIAKAMPLTRKIIAFESIWPLNTYSARDASKLSPSARERYEEAGGINLATYRELLAEREAVRATYAKLAEHVDGCVSLSANGAAPVGLASTGDPNFVVAGSLLGVPALSLPLLACEGLPIGLQLLGFKDRDAELFGIAKHIETTVGPDIGIRA